MKLGEDMSPEKMDKLLEEQGRLQDQIEAANAWELDHTVDMAMDALRCPPGDADVTKISGGERRRVALCRLLLSQARHAAARRADQPPRRRERRVARAHARGVQGHGRRDHPRSLLPRQRRQVDPRARSRRGPPVRGQLLGLARAQGQAPQGRGEAGRRARAHARARARVGAAVAEGPPGQEQGAPQPLRRDGRRGAEGGARRVARDRDPAGAAPRRRGRRRSRACPRRSAIAC